jgi:GT2 family glycosyltransferase
MSIRTLQCVEESYEILILDNGSSDKTCQVIRDLGFSYEVMEKAKVGTLRNCGAGLARGAYLAFVDSDVELTPNWLQQGLAPFKDQQVVAAGCFPRVPQKATWVQRAWDLQQRGRQGFQGPRPVSWLPSMNLLVRREAFLTVGGFNEQLTTAEDVDLCYRLGQRGIILNNPTMEAIHWGEARDLRAFWRKEVWRGTGNLSGVLSHGLRWDELPSVGYPLYVLFFVCVGLTSMICPERWRYFLMFLSFIFLIMPALALALRTGCGSGRMSVAPELFVLYLIYGFARAYSLVKSCCVSVNKRKKF